MADDETSIKLLIEAEDRSRDAFEQAKKRTEDLKKAETDLWKEINRAQNDATVSGKKFFEMRHQAVQTGAQLQRAYGQQAASLQQLVTAHQAVTAATIKHGQAATSAFGAAGQALLHYGKHFVSVAAAEEVIRRSIDAYAKFERGMARVQMESGATGKQMEHLGHSFEGMARMTGSSVEQLQGQFRAFRDVAGGSLDTTIHAFEDVVKAAHAAGVSVETMGRIAISAVKTMEVPFSELKGMLDVITQTVPASMLQAWESVGPKILSTLRSIGTVGKEHVQQAATAFMHLSQVMGSAEQGASVFQQLMSKSMDLGNNFGKVMVPQLIAIDKAGGTANDQFRAIYATMQKLGIDSDDPLKRLFIQQKFGFSEETVRGAREYNARIIEIDDTAKKLGVSFDEVEKRVLRLNRGPMAAVDDLKGALNDLWTEIGNVLGGTIPDTLAKMVTGIKNDMHLIVEAFKWWRSVAGAEPNKDTGAPGRSMSDRAGSWFGANVLPNWMTGQHGGAPTTALGTPVPGGPFGPGKYFGGGSVFGDSAGAPAATPTPQQNRIDAEIARRKRLRGYALGGSFEVPGQGGSAVDTEPVGFMGKPGERVSVTTPQQESLQAQQDKADIAMREHFARFHSSAFTKTGKADWWPAGGVRGPGGGGSVAGGGAGIPGGSQGGAGPTTAPPGTSTDSSGKVTPAAATSTAPAGTTPATLPGSVASLGYEPGKFTPVQDLTTASGTSGGAGGGGGLAADRAKFNAELAANPALREKVLAIANNEQGGNAQGMQATIESMMNRASYQGTTLAQQARWVSERGYYADGKKASGMNRPMTEAALTGALGGSNVSNYGTDNASTKWGADRIKRDLYRQTNYINGEYFSSPGQNPAGPGMGNFNKYQAWLERMKKGDAAAPAAAKESAVKTAKLTPNDNAPLPAGAFDPNLTKLPAAAPEAGVNMPAGAPGSPISGELWQGVGAHRAAYSNIGSHSHKGFDIGATLGQPIHAEGEGVVVKNEFQPGATGGIVTVKYKDGTTAKYMHLSNWTQEGIKPGATVKAGQVVGLAGASPGAPKSGVHLHVEYYDSKGNLVRPEDRHGWGKTDASGAGLRGRVVFAGIKGSFPPGTTREAALQQSGGNNKPATSPTNVKTATVKTTTADVDPSLLNPTLTPHNKPAAAPTNTKTATDRSAAGQKTDAQLDKASGKPGSKVAADPPVPVRRMPSAPGQEDTAAGKGTKVAAATPHPVSPQADPIPGRQWGGDVRGGRSYTVGESGPETFTPAGPGHVSPGGGMDIGAMMGQYRQFAEMLRSPITPNLQMPRVGPMQRRMSRRVEDQRERDVGRQSRHASHSDIGFT